MQLMYVEMRSATALKSQMMLKHMLKFQRDHMHVIYIVASQPWPHYHVDDDSVFGPTTIETETSQYSC